MGRDNASKHIRITLKDKKSGEYIFGAEIKNDWGIGDAPFNYFQGSADAGSLKLQDLFDKIIKPWTENKSDTVAELLQKEFKNFLGLK